MKQLAAALTLAGAAPAGAAEAFVGVAAHGLNLGFVEDRYEGGTALSAGVRSSPLARILGAEVRLHGLVQPHLSGRLSFAAAGASLRWPIVTDLYIAPGIGAAIHDGPGARFQASEDRLYLGSRVLFAPELTLGWRVAPRWSVEVNYVHLSHARLAGLQNPGLDTLGARIVHRFGTRDGR